MNTMTYRKYSARIDHDDEDRLFIGHVAGIRDVIGLHGESVEELEQAFHEAVDNYLAACGQLGQSPEKPASGRLMPRVPPDVHRSALCAAELSGKGSRNNNFGFRGVEAPAWQGVERGAYSLYVTLSATQPGGMDRRCKIGSYCFASPKSLNQWAAEVMRKAAG